MDEWRWGPNQSIMVLQFLKFCPWCWCNLIQNCQPPQCRDYRVPGESKFPLTRAPLYLSCINGSAGLSKGGPLCQGNWAQTGKLWRWFCSGHSGCHPGNSASAEYGNIIDGIRILVADFDFIHFNHVKHNCNVVADALAKKAKTLSDLVVWLEDVPEDIASLLLFDVP